MEPEILVVVGNHDVSLSMSEGVLLLVRGALQARIICGGNVDAARPEPLGVHWIDVLSRDASLDRLS